MFNFVSYLYHFFVVVSIIPVDSLSTLFSSFSSCVFVKFFTLVTLITNDICVFWKLLKYYIKVKNDGLLGFGMRLYIFLVSVCYDCLMFIQQEKKKSKDAHLEDCH